MLIPNDIRQDIPWEKKDDADRGIKTLFWLHGYTGRSENWVPEELCEKYQIAVVMPTAENSFYLDGEATGRGVLFTAYTPVDKKISIRAARMDRHV